MPAQLRNDRSTSNAIGAKTMQDEQHAEGGRQEVRGQRSAVGLARTVGAGSACLLPDVLNFGQRRLHFLKAELELIGIELLGTAPEAVALEGLDDRAQALDLRP